MKLPNCLSLTTQKIFTLTLLCCIGLTACKKDKDDPKKSFSEYEGNWKPVFVGQWNGLKAASFPSGIYYFQWKDKIVYIEMEFRADTFISGSDTFINTNVSKEKYRDTCDFTYLITTTVDDDANLTLKENYVLMKAGQVYKTLNYNGTIHLVEGQSKYGTPTYYEQTIFPDSIKISEYYWSGINAWTKDRRLVKK